MGTVSLGCCFTSPPLALRAKLMETVPLSCWPGLATSPLRALNFIRVTDGDCVMKERSRTRNRYPRTPHLCTTLDYAARTRTRFFASFIARINFPQSRAPLQHAKHHLFRLEIDWLRVETDKPASLAQHIASGSRVTPRPRRQAAMREPPDCCSCSKLNAPCDAGVRQLHPPDPCLKATSSSVQERGQVVLTCSEAAL